MKFDRFLSTVGNQPYFSLATLGQLIEEPRHTLRIQLSRWEGEGKLLRLRRGLYALAEPYRQQKMNPAVLCNNLYRPSYISLHWALQYYGLIPEMVALYTAVTTRTPRVFTNAFGHFQYTNIKRSLFFGYQPTLINEQNVLLATPEKTLLDLWHLEKGEWDKARMVAMRFQNTEQVNGKRLLDYAKRMSSPRINRAIIHWRSLENE